MALSAGRLRQRIDLVRPTRTRNDRGGGYTTTLADLAIDVPAEVLGLVGGEAVKDKLLQGIRVYRITMRWRGDLLQSDQIRYAGDADLLNIRSIADPDGRRRELVIVADSDAALRTAA